MAQKVLPERNTSIDTHISAKVCFQGQSFNRNVNIQLATISVKPTSTFTFVTDCIGEEPLWFTKTGSSFLLLLQSAYFSRNKSHLRVT